MALNFANNNSLSAITTKPSGLSGGAMNLISTQTASSSSTISFTSGIDDTYDEYVFKFYDIHGSADSHFGFNGSIDSGSNYNVTKTTTYFHAWHAENDADHGVGYYTDSDIAQGTGFQRLMRHIGADNDQCGAGYLHLFNPSSTTFAKNFIATTSMSNKDDLFYNPYVAGYFNSTSAIDAIQFKMESGNIDSGIIKLFGVS